MAYVTAGSASSEHAWRSRGDERTRIDTLRIILIVLLVFLHFGGVHRAEQSPFDGYAGQADPVASIVVSFVLFLAFTAVPLLAAVSGYLFFQGASARRPPDFLRQWRRRLRSLVVPFLIWSAGAVAVAAIVNTVVPGIFERTLGDPASRDVLRVADAILGVTMPPLSIQFWFVRDLIVAVALAPVVWLGASRAPALSLAALASAWLTEQTLGVFLRLDTFVFFWFGATLAIHRIDVTPNERLAGPLMAAFLVAVGLRTLAPWLSGVTESPWIDLGTSLMRVLGVAAVWSASGHLARSSVGRIAAPWAPAAFFIYCAHFPLVIYIKSALGRVMAPAGDAALLAHYLLTVALTLSLLGLAIILLSRIAPGLLALLSGGRLGHARTPAAA